MIQGGCTRCNCHLSSQTVEYIALRAEYAALEQAAREYIESSTSPRNEYGMCEFCQEPRFYHRRDCEYIVRKDRIVALLDPAKSGEKE